MILTCGIFLLDHQNNILICHPTHAPWNSWGIPKGLQDSNEDTKTTAIREFLEETGINLTTILEDPDKEIQYLGQVEYKNRKKILVAYWTRIPTTIPIKSLECTSMVTDKGDPFPEVDKYKWAPIENAQIHLPQRTLLPLLSTTIKKEKS